MTQRDAPVWVGTCAWDKSAWQGGFYDKGVRRSERLRFASRLLKTIEINATFHGPKSPKDFLSWHAQTPEAFILAAKGPREITHDRELHKPDKNLAAFLASGVLLLAEKLGPILWQISEHHPFDAEVVDRFLAALPHSVAEAQELIRQNAAGIEVDPRILALPDRRIRRAFEARHASFGNPTFIDMLRRHNVAAVLTNSPKWLELRELTSDFIYLRFHGDVRRYPNGYDDATLAAWAAQIDGWRTGRSTPDRLPREVFVYFDNPEGGGASSPHTARKLQQLVDGEDAIKPMQPQPQLF